MRARVSTRARALRQISIASGAFALMLARLADSRLDSFFATFAPPFDFALPFACHDYRSLLNPWEWVFPIWRRTPDGFRIPSWSDVPGPSRSRHRHHSRPGQA